MSNGIREVDLEALKRELDHGAVTVLDVREESETQAGVVPGAITIPRDLLHANVARCIEDKAAPIVTMCATGVRSLLAAETLAGLGYTNVRSATPGFSRWRELGYAVAYTGSRGAAERPPLTSAQHERYARHLALPEVGESGQARLMAGRVLVVGAGGLGSPAALYLAAAGVGTIGIVDHDVVDLSNLQRQILHTTARVGSTKVESASRTLSALNPEVTVVGHTARLDDQSVEGIAGGYDVIVDGTDNFATRYVLNDASVRLGIAVVHGAIFRFEGQATTFVPARAAEKLDSPAGPCYRCLFPEPPPPELALSCREAGVLGVLPGIIGTIQATETLKLLLGRGTSLVGRLLTYDSLHMSFRELAFRRDANCVACG